MFRAKYFLRKHPKNRNIIASNRNNNPNPTSMDGFKGIEEIERVFPIISISSLYFIISR